MDKRWHEELSGVEFGVEDTPQLPADWADEPVPLAALVEAGAGEPTRIVVFRRPIELRASSRVELTALVHEILVEQIADLLGKEPDEIDP
jgi:predicted Zn-dependent protease with MMP-like domain